MCKRALRRYNAAKGRQEGAGAVILLLEDDPATMLLTRTVLEEAGYRILAATSLYDARELLELEHPDLVITDVVREIA